MLIKNTYIYEIKSIGLSERKGRKPQNLLDAARHNLREIQAETGADYGKIDPRRMHLNEVLIGPASAREVLAKANKLFDEVGIDQSKLRKDYNQASEHVFSLRAGQIEGDFFNVIAECSKRIFGKDKVLSFVVHRDQDHPHAHMLVSPISDGKYLGSKLHDHGQLKRFKAEYRKSAETIGFTPVPEARLTRKKLSEMTSAIVSYLEHVNDRLLYHPLWPAILDMVIKNPMPFYQRLNLENVMVPKTMSQVRLIAEHTAPSVRNRASKGMSEHQYLPCVGFSNPVPLDQVVHDGHSAEADESVSVVRDNEIRTEYYDLVTGEFSQPLHTLRSNKSDAEKWVSSALYKFHERRGRN